MTFEEFLVQRGERTGEQRALREALRKLLRTRFGDLPESVRARIDAAERPQLDAWLDRVLNARSLDEVLAAS